VYNVYGYATVSTALSGANVMIVSRDHSAEWILAIAGRAVGREHVAFGILHRTVDSRIGRGYGLPKHPMFNGVRSLRQERASDQCRQVYEGG
jgi:hypothetical protein